MDLGPLDTPPRGGFGAGKISTVHINQMLASTYDAKIQIEKSKILQVQDYKIILSDMDH